VSITDFNMFDIFVLIVLVGSAVGGFISGFARVGISFLAAIGGLVFGLWFYGLPAHTVQKYVGSPTVANLAGFLVIFLGAMAAGAVLGVLLSKLFKWTGLTWLDRTVGAAFGAVRGGLMVVAVVAVLMAFAPSPKPDWMVESQLLPYAVDASDLCASLAPNGLKTAFRDSLEEVRKAWQEQVKKSKKHRQKEAEV
jgi:membrane protein required for colicin V production